MIEGNRTVKGWPFVAKKLLKLGPDLKGVAYYYIDWRFGEDRVKW